MVFDLPHYHHS
jgi:hypothetical protein